MIVGNLDFDGVAVVPAETDPPLFVDPNAVLPGPIALQFLQAVSGRDAQVVKRFGRIDQEQFPECGALRRLGKPGSPLPQEQSLRVLVAETPDHRWMITSGAINVQRYVPCPRRQPDRSGEQSGSAA